MKDELDITRKNKTALNIANRINLEIANTEMCVKESEY